MTFAQPLLLWTLSAVAVPIAIHLLSRREGKVMKVGSLRHLEESNTSRFKSLRLNEILLLLLRCLMIAWIALFLSGASYTSLLRQDPIRWLVIEPGIEQRPEVAELLDSITNTGAELHFLARDFPIFRPSDSTSVADYWSLAEQLGRKIDHEIIVLSYNRANGFTQIRPHLPANITWVPLSPPQRNFIVSATRVTPDSVISRRGHSNEGGTSFTTVSDVLPVNRKWVSLGSYPDSTMIFPRDTISVAVVSDDDHKRDATLLNAALNAMTSIPGILVKHNNTSPEWTFWLRSDEPRRPLTSNTILLRPADSDEWIRKEGKSEWHLTRRLNADEVVKEHFVIELAQTLLPSSHDKLKRMDVRSLPEEMSWSNNAGSNIEEAGVARDLSTILIILFIVTWAGERLLALRRNL